VGLVARQPGPARGLLGGVHVHPTAKLAFATLPPTKLAFMSDSRRRFNNERCVHFITFSVYRRRRLLDLDQPKRLVLGVLNHQLKAMSAHCVGFVLMPDHVHALIWLPESSNLTRFIHGWKRMSSFRIRQWYAEKSPNYFSEFGPGDKFWQPKSYVFHVYSEHKLHEKLDYMHLTRVRAGLVARAEAWKWSSARWYLTGRTVGVPIAWID
jgi:putative transposase